MKPISLIIFAFILFSCQNQPEEVSSDHKDLALSPMIKEKTNQSQEGIQLIVLGNVQDAGYPHAGCKKECCKELFDHPDPDHMVVSLGIIDHDNNQSFLVEATPDLPRQMKLLQQHSNQDKETPDGIFISHAHIGHYAGLMYLGRESMNSDKVKVYTYPRMADFIENNAPWEQLISLENITLQKPDELNLHYPDTKVKIETFLVPHRDEYSETAGFIISGAQKSALFIPDIDKWHHWERDITEVIKKVDYAFLDATFYDAAEVNNRNIAEIPHPFVIESMEAFEQLTIEEKNKIYFIHLNHTNPLLNEESKETKTVKENGYNVARFLDTFEL